MKILAFPFALWLALLAAAPLSAQPVEPIDSIVAVVNDDVILRSELDTALDDILAQIRQRSANVPPREAIERRVLEQLIIQKIQLQMAEKTGIRVDDNTLNLALRRVASSNHLTLSQFRKRLQQDGINYEAFRNKIRDKLILQRLQQREVANRITITDAEVDQFLATQRLQKDTEGEWHIAQILVAVPDAATPEQIQAAKRKAESIEQRLRNGADFHDLAVAESDGQNALEGGDLGWRNSGQLPSFFTDVVPNMNKGDISLPIRSPSGFHVVKVLDYRGGHAHTVTQTHARHILIRTNESTSEEQARTRLAQLKQRIEGGDDFASLARAHSDDTGSGSRGGDLGWTNPGDLVPRFEAQMNRLRPGEISEPFQTQFGWHIVQVLARRTAEQGDDVVRTEARKVLRERMMEEELQAWARRIRDEAYVDIRIGKEDQEEDVF